MSPHFLLTLGLIALAQVPNTVRADDKEEDKPLSKELTIERIHNSKDFKTESYSVRWLKNGSAYLRTVDSKETKDGKDIVSINPETGDETVVVASQDLIPPKRTAPLAINGYTIAEDHSKVLIFTNSKKVWRKNTRGDYWTLDLSSLELRQIGVALPPTSLMHAKLSPNGQQVGYASGGNLYVETLRTGELIQLTESGSNEVSNGTFDWVNEEEFRLYDGWRWSPNSESIAYWQCDSNGVNKYPIIDYTSGL